MNKRYKRKLVAGDKINNLEVLERTYVDKGGNVHLKMKCFCGSVFVVAQYSLKKGDTTSCGCLKREAHTTHYMTHTRQYKTWCNMKSRCSNKSLPQYKDYGGRGIKVCDRWLVSFENFWEDMSDGYSSKLTIDRQDNNGNYCKENCKWISSMKQSLNKRNNIHVRFNGKRYLLSFLAKKFNIGYHTLYARLFTYNWDIEKALLTPVKPSFIQSLKL